MVSDNGIQGSPCNEAADTCATHGKRGAQPRTTGSIQELMAHMTNTRLVRGPTDESQATDAHPATRQDTGTTVTTDDGGTQDAGGANGTQVDGHLAQECHGDGRADGFRPNMHRAISGAIWGASLLDEDACSGEDDIDGDCTTGTQ
jgi:hypothetical protein